MKKLWFVFALVLLMLTNVAVAHHSRANFDSEQLVELVGTIVDYAWRNPHVFVEIEAPDANGDSQIWLVESHSVTGMRGNGWDRDSLVEGEQVTIVGSPDKNPNKHFVLMNYVEKAGGERLYAFRNPDAEPVERQIMASEDFSGTWDFDLRSFNTRLAGGPPPADWDYTETALLDIESFAFDQNPELECLAIGVPRITIYPYGTNIQRLEDRILIHKEHLNEKRVVWLDANAEGLQNQEPSYVGTSYGYFESPRHLIIETSNFLPTRWGIANGVHSSAEKTVVEEFILSEDGLSIDITARVTDPVYLNKTVVSTGRFLKAEDRDFVETPCDPTAASRHLSLE